MSYTRIIEKMFSFRDVENEITMALYKYELKYRNAIRQRDRLSEAQYQGNIESLIRLLIDMGIKSENEANKIYEILILGK